MRSPIVASCLALFATQSLAQPLGLPPVPIPAENPQTPDKIALGKRLFEDPRFSSTGSVSCATCHDPAKAFTDSPLATSKGVNGAQGTRNAPTVLNAAYLKRQFWDGRSPDLEDQSRHPFVNPIEMGLKDHEPILAIVRSDREYAKAFQSVFGKEGAAITLKEVTQAIASFERTVLSGDSPFDRYHFGGNREAMSPAAARGLAVFVGQGRCVSCHVIEQDQALFTDNRFHNIGVGINRIQDDVPALAGAFLDAKARGVDVDLAVLSNPKTSELGRFAVTDQLDEMGAFKTPTLRDVARTAPYMHDGSLKTLAEVVEHYNNGGTSDPKAKVNPYLSGGIRPLGLNAQQKADLVAFLEALSSIPEQKSAPPAKAKRSAKP